MADGRDRQQEPNNSRDPPRQTRTKPNSTRPRGSSDPASYQPQTVKKQIPENSTSRYQHLCPSDALPAHQQFSLAGSLAQQPHAPSYIDPKYHELNPGYRKLRNTPVWGLAKPLPRVVRPGMKRKLQNGQQVVEDEGAERPEPGSAHAIPQVGMIDDQRQSVGKERFDGDKDVGDRGYGHQGGGRIRSERTVQRVGSYNDVVHQCWTPSVEKGNPMEDWRPRWPSYRSSAYDPFEDQNGNLWDKGMRRLSSVQEVPSKSTSASASLASVNFANENANASKIDLEAREPVGDRPLDDEEAEQYAREATDTYNNIWVSVRAKFREPLAECLATMIAVLIGVCTNLAVQTSNNTAGSYQSTNWAWGLGITIGIYIAGGISGGHLNPAISLALCLYRGFPFRKAVVYIFAQVLGGFFAGLIAYGVYRDAIISFDANGGATAAEGGSTQALGLFAGGSGKSFFTQPASFNGVGAGFANEFVATAILSCTILALGDDSNAPPGAGMHALIVGLVVTVLTMAFGYNTGACLNPARDFGPRVATAVLGYGGEVFTVKNSWWIYGAWGATISGALVGGLLYDMAIFVGGESPVNFPKSRRIRMKNKAKRRWFGMKKVVDEGFKGELGNDG